MNPICVLFLAGADFGLEVDTFKKLDFVLLEGLFGKIKKMLCKVKSFAHFMGL